MFAPGQQTELQADIVRPEGRIHFAGEHCSQDFQGYMEGGASEGVRAAGEILAALK
jgi:monoamine oxidase